ncbi:MAG: hypothetical protein BGO95_03855 [Micrococcales bacterium 73-13]|nr:MAG: hypothetical protein BGO95_03855 [Micrococcales bacterium 73-13]
MSRTRAAVLPLALAAAIGAAAAVAIAAPAAAHSTIIDSTPAAGEEIAEAPASFSVTANEDLSDLTGTGQGFALRVVFVPTGEDVSTGRLTIDGPTLSTPGVPLQSGPYLLEYQVVSADGHPVSGEIPFTVATDDATTPTMTPEPTPDAEPPATGNGAAGAEPDGADPALWGWIVGGAIVLAGVAAGVIALVARRRG